MTESGKQVMVLNIYHPTRTFYDWYGVEHEVRTMAEKFKHTYTIALFGCCRTIFNSQKHSGYVKGTTIQGLVKFDRAEH